MSEDEEQDYKMEISYIISVRAKNFKEARDKSIKDLLSMEQEEFMHLKVTNQETHEYKFMDGFDCCGDPMIAHDGACDNCGEGQK
jgi:hypothetical protein